jgi:hypothetical protein
VAADIRILRVYVVSLFEDADSEGCGGLLMLKKEVLRYIIVHKRVVGFIKRGVLIVCVLYYVRSLGFFLHKIISLVTFVTIERRHKMLQ